MTVTPLVTVTTVTDQVQYQSSYIQKAKGLRCLASSVSLRASAPEAACSPPSMPMFDQNPLQRDRDLYVYIATTIFDSLFTIYSASHKMHVLCST